MKNFLLCLFLCFSLNAFSQDYDPDKRDVAKNELSIGALNLVIFGALDLAYERILTESSSWALEAFILALNENSSNVADIYSRDFSLTGKYKYFFGKGTASGLYANGFAMYNRGEFEEQLNGTEPVSTQTKNYSDFALGFGVGGKFVAKGGFFVDLGAGLGRNLFNSDSPTIVGQINVNLGMRF